jgi:hypothetical protein
MMRRNAFFQVERIEQPTLIAGLPPHHDLTPSPKLQGNGITPRLRSRALFQQHRPISDIPVV